MANESFQLRLRVAMEALHTFTCDVVTTKLPSVTPVLKVCRELLVCIEAEASSLDTSCDFIGDWSAITWALLGLSRRAERALTVCAELHVNDALIQDWHQLLAKKHELLVRLVNRARPIPPPSSVTAAPSSGVCAHFQQFHDRFAVALHSLHDFYAAVAGGVSVVDELQMERTLADFHRSVLSGCLMAFRRFADVSGGKLLAELRTAQILRMVQMGADPKEELGRLAEFYASVVYPLAVLASRLDGFRHEALFVRQFFAQSDCIGPMLDEVYTTLDVCLNDCILATEPSDYGILVTNNLFEMRCLSLVRGFAFKDFHVQIVSEETAAQIQGDMRAQRTLQQLNCPMEYPSAAMVAIKNTFATKRNGEGTRTRATLSAGARGASDALKLPLAFEPDQRTWQAGHPHLMCTTRHKERTLSGDGKLSISSNASFGVEGKRDLFYFHLTATMHSASGQLRTVRSLSLPFVIATRRNQDSQVQRMSSSYTATVFWLYANARQDGLLIRWPDQGMLWPHFKRMYSQYFRVNANVERGLSDTDFELLKWKMKCTECGSDETPVGSCQQEMVVTFRNLLCCHLCYEVQSNNVRFSVWRGMLHLLQIFHDQRNKVRRLWEQQVVYGFVDYDDVAARLLAGGGATTPMLLARISCITGGAVCLSAQTPAGIVHLEPLDFKRLQQRSLLDYLHDVSYGDKIHHILNANGEPTEIASLLRYSAECDANGSGGGRGESADDQHCAVQREIASNVEHSGAVDRVRRLRFQALRIAVVTCQLPSPTAVTPAAVSDRLKTEDDGAFSFDRRTVSTNESRHDSSEGGSPQSSIISSSVPSSFVEELRKLMIKHEKSKEDIVSAIESLSQPPITATSVTLNSVNSNSTPDCLFP